MYKPIYGVYFYNMVPFIELDGYFAGEYFKRQQKK